MTDKSKSLTGRKLAKSGTLKQKPKPEPEPEKIPSGWSVATVTKLQKLKTEPEMLTQVLSIMSVNEHDYQYDFKATTTVDFHFANYLHFVEVGYSMRHIVLLSKIFTKLWSDSVKAVQSPDNDFDQLRAYLVEQTRILVSQMNATDAIFTPTETENFLCYVTQVLIRPIRLLMHPFYSPPNISREQQPRKLNRPVPPVPLMQCNPVKTVRLEEHDFPMLPFFTTTTLPLEDLRRMVTQYTDGMIAIINERYDFIDQEMARVLPLLNG
jgi:hypothetical protein